MYSFDDPGLGLLFKDEESDSDVRPTPCATFNYCPFLTRIVTPPRYDCLRTAATSGLIYLQDSEAEYGAHPSSLLVF